MKRLAVVLLVVVAGCGGEASSDLSIPRDPASVAAGEPLYAANCARCHGEDLDGGRVPGGGAAPSLLGAARLSDEVITATIVRGRGMGMPAFGTQLDDTEIASIVDYVRSVQAADAAG